MVHDSTERFREERISAGGERLQDGGRAVSALSGKLFTRLPVICNINTRIYYTAVGSTLKCRKLSRMMGDL